MNVTRPEIRTGALVVITLAVLVGVVLYLGAPGVFVPENKFKIYVDNAAGLRPGNEVLLAGRRVGQVRRLYSPVPEADRPDPKKEVLIEVTVARSARIYKNVRVLLTQNGFLGEMLLDFTSGNESAGVAPDGSAFLGERPPGLDQAVPQVLDKLEPALLKATETLDSLQKTAENLTVLTAEDGQVQQTLREFRSFGDNLKDLSSPEGPLRKALMNVETLTADDGKLGIALDNVNSLTGPKSDLAKTMSNAENITSELANNKDIAVTLQNFRQASEKLNDTLGGLSGQFTNIAGNLEQATDTVKKQPWRLIWPSTKKYGDEEVRATPAPRNQPGSRKRARVIPRRDAR